MRAASIARMPRVIPPKSGTRGIDASENGGEHDGEKKELKEVTALQDALKANRAHHTKVEALQFELDEQGRALSDDVRKKMTALREAVNARERELLAELQVQLSARQSAIDEGLHVAEHSWRSLTQLHAAMKYDGGSNGDKQEVLTELASRLSHLNHLPQLPSVQLPLLLSVEQALATVKQLSFAAGDDALHLAWKEKTGGQVGVRHLDLRVKELSAQLKMVATDNARLQDEAEAGSRRLRQMDEAAAAHAAEEMRLHLEEQVMVERQKKLVQELQTAQQALTADVKDKEIQHRQDILEMQALSAEKEQMLMMLIQESEEEQSVQQRRHEETKARLEETKARLEEQRNRHELELQQLRLRLAEANSMAENMRMRAAELAFELNREGEEKERALGETLREMERFRQFCERSGEVLLPHDDAAYSTADLRNFSEAYAALASSLPPPRPERDNPPDASHRASAGGGGDACDVAALLVAAAEADDRALHAERGDVMELAFGLVERSLMNQNEADELEAVLRDEYRVHLQRNFLIWYREEEHLKEQLQITKELVEPLAQEVEELRQVARDSQAVAVQLRRVHSYFDLIYQDMAKIENELRSRGSDMTQLRDEVAVVLRLVHECRTPSKLLPSSNSAWTPPALLAAREREREREKTPPIKSAVREGGGGGGMRAGNDGRGGEGVGGDTWDRVKEERVKEEDGGGSRSGGGGGSWVKELEPEQPLVSLSPRISSLSPRTDPLRGWDDGGRTEDTRAGGDAHTHTHADRYRSRHLDRVRGEGKTYAHGRGLERESSKANVSPGDDDRPSREGGGKEEGECWSMKECMRGVSHGTTLPSHGTTLPSSGGHFLSPSVTPSKAASGMVAARGHHSGRAPAVSATASAPPTRPEIAQAGNPKDSTYSSQHRTASREVRKAPMHSDEEEEGDAFDGERMRGAMSPSHRSSISRSPPNRSSISRSISRSPRTSPPRSSTHTHATRR